MSTKAGSVSTACAVQTRPPDEPTRKLSRDANGWAAAADSGASSPAASSAILIIARLPGTIALLLLRLAGPLDRVRPARHRLVGHGLGGEACVDQIVARLGRTRHVQRPADPVGAVGEGRVRRV